MSDGRRSRLPVAALGFAVAAAFSSWNPLAAPFGLIVGVAALVLAVRALRRGAAATGPAGAAALVSLAAVATSGLVLALTAGVGRELAGAPILQVPGRGDVSAELDQAAERSRAARERAKAELDALEPSVAGSVAAPPRRGGR